MDGQPKPSRTASETDLYRRWARGEVFIAEIRQKLGRFDVYQAREAMIADDRAQSSEAE